MFTVTVTRSVRAAYAPLAARVTSNRNVPAAVTVSTFVDALNVPVPVPPLTFAMLYAPVPLPPFGVSVMVPPLYVNVVCDSPTAACCFSAVYVILMAVFAAPLLFGQSVGSLNVPVAPCDTKSDLSTVMRPVSVADMLPPDADFLRPTYTIQSASAVGSKPVVYFSFKVWEPSRQLNWCWEFSLLGTTPRCAASLLLNTSISTTEFWAMLTRRKDAGDFITRVAEFVRVMFVAVTSLATAVKLLTISVPASAVMYAASPAVPALPPYTILPDPCLTQCESPLTCWMSTCPPELTTLTVCNGCELDVPARQFVTTTCAAFAT